MGVKVENIFQSIPENLSEEFFELLVENENVKIERIVSKGHTSPNSGWYDQNRGEWVIVLKGEAIISFVDGSECNLIAGSHLNIPAHTKHRVKWTKPDTETVWLAIHY
ncbi:MAG: cupin domain-containing protein [Pseudomonadales bacterium]|nr:cupin domain-containing protein [Pseudomonadales bacterium]